MPSTDSALAIATLGASGLAALLISEWRALRSGIVAGKLTASTAFVLLALLGGLAGAFEHPAGWLFFAGMSFCWLGDALLLSPGQSLGFRAGIGAFLLAHLAYAIGCHAAGVDASSFAQAVIGVGLVGAIALRWLWPHVPADFRLAVGLYFGVIGLMVASAIGATAAGASPGFAAGAILFAISDLSVARERFVAPSFANSAWGLPLYYAAQGLLALSMADL